MLQCPPGIDGFWSRLQCVFAICFGYRFQNDSYKNNENPQIIHLIQDLEITNLHGLS